MSSLRAVREVSNQVRTAAAAAQASSNAVGMRVMHVCKYISMWSSVRQEYSQQRNVQRTKAAANYNTTTQNTLQHYTQYTQHTNKHTTQEQTHAIPSVKPPAAACEETQKAACEETERRKRLMYERITPHTNQTAERNREVRILVTSEI